MASLLTACFFLLCSLSLTTAVELATQVCQQTTDFQFCHDVLYSDPKTPTADRVNLAYIAFRQAYSNATQTRDLIATMLKSSTTPVVHAGLAKCMRSYKQAVWDTVEALGDLDSDSYDMVDIWRDVDRRVHECENSLKGSTGSSQLSQGNNDMLKLSDICLVISKLFVANHHGR